MNVHFMEMIVKIFFLIGAVALPVLIVWLNNRKKINETNQRTQIVLAAIEKNAETDGEPGAASAVDPSLTRFLDADTVEKKLEVLFKEKSRLTPKTLMLIELSLGLEVQDGDTEDRYQRIRNNLQTRQKYERHRPG